MQYFESSDKPHPLNYKYKDDRIIDVSDEYNAPQLSAASAFFNASIFSNKLLFDETLKTTEDAKLITQILASKMRYGVLQQPTYYYRKRHSLNSVSNNARQDINWYLRTPLQAYQYILNLGKESKSKGFSQYTQYLVMYDLTGRFKHSDSSSPSQRNVEKYKSTLFELVRQIDDEVIMKQRGFNREYKYYLLYKKYGKPVVENTYRRDWIFFFNNLIVQDYRTSRPKVKIMKIETSKKENPDHL